MNKRKLQEYNNARNDGMEFALRIVEEKGIEGLKEELKFRQCIPLPSSVTRDMFLDAMLKFKNDTVDLITLVANCTLDREFEFNAEQLDRFTTRFNLIIDCLNDKDNVLPQELLDNLREETGYNLVLKHMFNVK
jgi:hypothetical protein